MTPSVNEGVDCTSFSSMQVHFVDTLRVDFVELLIGVVTTLIVDLTSVSLLKTE